MCVGPGRASRVQRQHWTRLASTGRLTQDLLPELWPELESAQRSSVLQYMAHFDLCCTVGNNDSGALDVLVPSLLPAAPFTCVWAADAANDRRLRVRTIPPGILVLGRPMSCMPGYLK